ncbi:MAG: deoxyribonuclease IV [Chlamydiae bacterium]|nr:deoxyribonuclease IV [Chlamydiota bacterium]
MLLGAHMSIEGGAHEALIRSVTIGCTTLQIFTKSNRQWTAKSLTQEEAELFKKTQKEVGITSVIAHASYLINIASGKADIHTKSINALTKELDRCKLLGIPYLVLHPGSRLNTPLEEALERVALGIDTALRNSQSDTMVLLETMAGQGTTVGSTFNELGTILKKISHKSQVGVCLDTCHVFAAGYDFTTKATYEKLWEDFDKEIGLENLKAIHINDSKKALGSHVDRHADIGTGEIGLEGFRLLMNDKRFSLVPKILETPKAQLLDDKRNMEKLLSLVEIAT